MKEYDFYVVPTPIGNLGDITLRAIDVLNSVDLIACEDSRVTQNLLNHFNIKTKCLSYHKYNEKERISQIVEFLEGGKKIALVSDAGTPLICDPGSVIVRELRKRGFSITSLAGANAVVTFLSQVSRVDEKFTFIGFLPKTTAQIEDVIKEHEFQDTVFYESPNRIMNTLKTIQSVRPDAKVAVGRELTKVFEEVVVDDITKVIEHFENNIVKLNAFSNTIFDEKDLVNISWQNRINIFKLNGDISNLNNIVITQSDIDNYQNNHALFLTFLKRELVTNTFIFIGYSFNDHIVLSALAEINQYLGESSNTHYTIMKNKHTDEFKMFIEDLEKRYHIKTVLVEEYAEIPLLLDKLKRRILDSNVFISGSFEYLPSAEDTFAYSLCKSLGEKLIDSNYNIVTGFGRNIGYYISGVVTQKIINNNI
ncbi:16S rRNA (cytidine(1402)-2'-O)-methyltransferase [bacterium]|nr:16S rRNA (cytidine(1402)-2'-O)-methyltransferase [bacterium]